MWIDPKDRKPDIGDVFVILFNDGSGATMIFRSVTGYFDCHGTFEDDEWRDHWSKWIKVSDDFKFHLGGVASWER